MTISEQIQQMVDEALKSLDTALPNPSDELDIVVSSPAFWTSSEDVHLIVDGRGQIVDAAIAPDRVTTLSMREKGYDDLPSIDLDVTGSQYRVLKKFAKSLAKTEKLRPSAKGRARKNPTEIKRAKSRCMR